MSKYWSNQQIGFAASSRRSPLEFNPYGHFGLLGSTKILGDFLPVRRDSKKWILVSAKASMLKSSGVPHKLRDIHNRICRPAVASQLRVWTWNIETLARPGYLCLMSDLASAHGIDAIFFQETRWRGCSSFGLPGEWWFVGISEGRGNDGVAMLMNRKLRASLLGFKLIFGRLMGI